MNSSPKLRVEQFYFQITKRYDPLANYHKMWSI